MLLLLVSSFGLYCDCESESLPSSRLEEGGRKWKKDLLKERDDVLLEGKKIEKEGSAVEEEEEEEELRDSIIIITSHTHTHT